MAKKNSQLVCQCLEKISRRMLVEHQGIIREFVGKHRNGVYAMYRRGKLYYVGLASSLLGRLKQHLRDRHAHNDWDRFSVYLTIGSAHMKEIESLLLRIADPPGNKVRGTFVNCANLLRELKTAYRLQRNQDEEELFGARKVWKGSKETGRKTKTSNGRQPALGKYAKRVKKLQAEVKGKTVKAFVRTDGTIRFSGRIYTSPSLAAAAACGRRTCNGWKFWTYEQAPGYWVLLNELRR